MVNRIRETLRRHLRVSGPEGSQELWKIARRFEEKIFAAASSQTDYRRKIYLKVFTIMETMYQGSQEPANPVDTNPRQHGSRNRRMPAWTDDYHMG
ncbi:hypothetical protein Ahy_B08g091945 isoform A [Arachis hypogaea]|uniref:Mediator complex subunit 15 KIX domain-containing protein n=1 Tax=Arachis hypogaea TaxID=3818 RepID=A0A444Y2T5_ARAHY|nr:hypothetical protein Ahy_B08g091945 isoform A [Arachis hypogaea]